MLRGILKKLGDFCSLKAPQGTTSNKWKSGFTIVELMVVIIIINVLSNEIDKDELIIPDNYKEKEASKISLKEGS